MQRAASAVQVIRCEEPTASTRSNQDPTAVRTYQVGLFIGKHSLYRRGAIPAFFSSFWLYMLSAAVYLYMTPKLSF